MFFTDYSVCKKFHWLVFRGKGKNDLHDHATCRRIISAAFDRGALQQLDDYFSKQLEILKRLRYHLYSESQFFKSSGGDESDLAQLKETYDVCRMIHEETVSLVQNIKLITGCIAKVKKGEGECHHTGAPCLQVWDGLIKLDYLVEKNREKVAFAVEHLKNSIHFYKKVEEDLMNLETEMKGL